MISIIKADLYRMLRAKSLLVIIIIIVTYIVVRVIPLYTILEKISGTKIMTDTIFYGYNAFESISIDSLFVFIVPFIVVSIFTTEFSKKTINVLLSRQKKRTQIFFWKIFKHCNTNSRIIDNSSNYIYWIVFNCLWMGSK